MRFKIDENLPLECAHVFRAFGHDATTVLEEGIGGGADQELLSVCSMEKRALVTLDLDFSDIRLYPPGEFPGIVVFRLSSQDKCYLLECLHRVMPLFETESLDGTLWIVEEERVRIRGSREG